MDISIKDIIAFSMSGASLIVSAYALWVTQFNHGRIRMTRPTLVCLKREFPKATPKIFLRMLLFSTGPKGRVVENMFLKITQEHGSYIFDFWGHTEAGKLTLGSGLFVGATGVASDHHFNPREGGELFLYVSGEYHVEVFATIIGMKKPQKLAKLKFTVDGNQSAELIQIPTRELLLFWNPITGKYDGQVEQRPN